jgi:hypothetical protein
MAYSQKRSRKPKNSIGKNIFCSPSSCTATKTYLTELDCSLDKIEGNKSNPWTAKPNTTRTRVAARKQQDTVSR